jgi:hypothetical protein
MKMVRHQRSDKKSSLKRRFDATAFLHRAVRLSIFSCEFCKIKKLRCDSSRPQCEHCGRKGKSPIPTHRVFHKAADVSAELGLDCIYKEKGQPGLRPGYGKDVERRLRDLEQKVNRMDQGLHNSRLASDAPEQETSAPGLHVPNTDEQPWAVPRPAPSEARVGMTSLSPSAVGPIPFPTSTVPVVSGAMPARQDLPPAEIMVDLVELFFTHVYPWAPLFEKLSFMANMWQQERELLLHGIVVCASRFWEKRAPSPNALYGQLQTSVSRLTLGCLETSSLVTTQALTLLAIDAMAQGPGTKIWMVRSMLNAAVQQLGLGKEQFPRTPEVSTPMVGNDGLDGTLETSHIASEERRRLFWTIFSVDHFASVALGQPSAIPPRTIKLRYPGLETQWYQPAAAGYFQAGAPVRGGPSGDAWRHYIDILTLLDRSNRLLIHPYDLSHPAKRQEWQSHFRMMTVTLATWLETCADECRNPNHNTHDPMWVIVRATYEL